MTTNTPISKKVAISRDDYSLAMIILSRVYLSTFTCLKI